jgi:hypothetical protein
MAPPSASNCWDGLTITQNSAVVLLPRAIFLFVEAMVLAAACA